MHVYVVTLARPLTDVWYRLEVVATDSGSLTTSSLFDLFVDVDDQTEQPSSPLRFSQSIYRATVSSGTVPGTCVTQVQVTAGDQGHRTIWYQRLDDRLPLSSVEIQITIFDPIQSLGIHQIGCGWGADV